MKQELRQKLLTLLADSKAGLEIIVQAVNDADFDKARDEIEIVQDDLKQLRYTLIMTGKTQHKEKERSLFG